jgi:methionyl-tRNA formyltransferase
MIAGAKVGVLMDSLKCPQYLFDILTRLSGEPNVELHLLRNGSHGKAGLARVMEKIRQVGLTRFVSIAFFNSIEYLERKAFSAIFPRIRRHFGTRELETTQFASTLLLSPVFSKSRISVVYPDEDIERIRALELDLILRGNGTGIYKGNILKAAKEGIISFHHGDNRWNRGGPPGFWEVFLEKPATGFVIQILNDRLDAGDVIFRGEAPTKRSYTENVVNLFEVANPFMAEIIAGYAATGVLPATLPKSPCSNALLRTPKSSVTFRYLVRMAVLFASLGLKRKILGLHSRWSVAFVESDWKDANLSKAKVIRNPPGRFLADPFVASRGGESVIFVEDYDYSRGKGVISAVRLLPDGSYEIVPGVVEEDFHLSFPYLFEFAGGLYMIPESQHARSIRLYQCSRFPDRWEYKMDLMKEVWAVDSMVFEHSGRWWLLTNIAPENSDEIGPALHAFSADSPLSIEWRAHSGNPVQFSAVFGRNGGLLKGQDGEIFRVRQRYGYNRYGAGSSVAKIEELTDQSYLEKSYCEIEPHFFERVGGTHHMHCDGRITVFDFFKEESLK